MATYQTEIIREVNINGADCETVVSIDVEYTYHPAHRGKRDSLMGKRGAGPQLEPDEPAHIEIEIAIDRETGNDIDLTEREEERIIEEISTSLAD